MGPPLCFMFSIGKTFFPAKVVDKHLPIKLLPNFTSIGPDTHILLQKYCHTSVVSHLMISSPPRPEQSCGQS